MAILNPVELKIETESLPRLQEVLGSVIGTARKQNVVVLRQDVIVNLHSQLDNTQVHL